MVLSPPWPGFDSPSGKYHFYIRVKLFGKLLSLSIARATFNFLSRASVRYQHAQEIPGGLVDSSG